MGKPKRIKKRQAKASSKLGAKEENEKDSDNGEEEDGMENTFEAVFGDAELFDWGTMAAEKLFALDEGSTDGTLMPSFNLDMGKSLLCTRGVLLLSECTHRQSKTTDQVAPKKGCRHLNTIFAAQVRANSLDDVHSSLTIVFRFGSWCREAGPISIAP